MQLVELIVVMFLLFKRERNLPRSTMPMFQKLFPSSITHILNKTMPTSFFSIQHSLAEYTDIDFVYCSYLRLAVGKIVYHAGVAAELWLLKLKNMGRVHMLMGFTTNFILAECTSDFVLSNQWIFCSAMRVHHAGVAAKVAFMLEKFLTLLNIGISSFVSLAECNMINFGLRLLKTSSAKVMHHAGVAAKKDLRQMKNKQMDRVMQECRKVQNPNFFLVVGVLQLCVSWTQFEFCSSGIFLVSHVEASRISPS